MKSRVQIEGLGTEAVNDEAASLDTMPALEIALLMNDEDKTVAGAVEHALPRIARAIDLIAEALGAGGRLIYVGCGTSGRIAALDAAEIQPTFGSDARQVQYVIAGGERALDTAAEYDEDSRALGRQDLARRRPSKKDVVAGISASGRTPYTLAALEYAKKKGAKTIAVVCNSGSPMEQAADISIVADVGPEVVAGSTRLKAGTAQKLVTNMLTTGAMARLGRVYGNLMVNVDLKNEKLVERGIAVLQRAAGCDRETAQRVLRQAGNQVAVALVMLKSGIPAVEARRRLKAAGGHVRRAIEGATEKKRRSPVRRRS
jgi:N-acetylmuramic acid 6-phosphate etherase